MVESVGRARFPDEIEVEEIERKERLKTKWAQLEAVVAHGARLPFADATFDCAVASEVIEHPPEPERVPDEMWRVVRPGGRALISTPYRERIRYVLCIHILPKPAHIVVWRDRASSCSARVECALFGRVASLSHRLRFPPVIGCTIPFHLDWYVPACEILFMFG